MTGNNLLSKLEEDIQYAKTTGQMVKEEKESLEALLKENLRYNQAIYADTQKIRRYMLWRLIMTLVFWIVFIIAPTILALVYLPTAIGEFQKTFQSAVGQGQSGLDLIDQLNKIK